MSVSVNFAGPFNSPSPYNRDRLLWASVLHESKQSQIAKAENVLDDSIRRTKLSHDPNNTAWTRSSSNYGQRLLQSQGWQPGFSLGATNASYVDKTASTAFIRVALKEDNLGLGAKVGSGHQDEGEPTGLDAFQSILGRLNGKDAGQIRTEKNLRSDIRKTIAKQNRWGAFRFVSGGFLIGDRVQEYPEGKEECREEKEDCLEVKETPPRHRPDPSANASRKNGGNIVEENRKRRRKIKSRRNSEQSRNPKGEKDSEVSAQASSQIVMAEEVIPDTESSDIGLLSRSLVGMDKPSIQEAKARSIKIECSHPEADELAAKIPDARRHKTSKKLRSVRDEPLDMAKPSIPIGTRPNGRRHISRHRYLHQKKMSIMNSKALNEVKSLPMRHA